jgi:hypothetical protein
MKKINIILSLLFFCVSIASTQTVPSKEEEEIEKESKAEVKLLVEEEEFENHWQYSKEVGINMTNLVSRLVPFNLTSKSTFDQIVALKTKWYGSKLAFIINADLNINANENNSSVFLSMGYERRRHVTRKIKYTTGWEAMIFVNGVDFEGNIGLAKPYGFEYHFSDKFFLSTEARLIVAIADNGPVIKLFYPNSLFLNVRL